MLQNTGFLSYLKLKYRAERKIYGSKFMALQFH